MGGKNSAYTRDRDLLIELSAPNNSDMPTCFCAGIHGEDVQIMTDFLGKVYIFPCPAVVQANQCLGFG
jgi:hypothetical protein